MTNQKLSKRYRSGYWAGKLVHAVGILMTLAGVVLAALVAIGAAEVCGEMAKNAQVTQWISDNLRITVSQEYAIVVSVAFMLGLILFLFFWLAGTFVSALAQILKALLDTAVNTSPFLSLEEKQKAIR